MSSFSSYLQSFASRFSYGACLAPARDWSVLLSVAAVALVLIVGWNVRAFQTVVQGGVLGVAATSSPPAISQSSIDMLRALFNEREAEEANYASGTYRFTDPSQ